MKRSKKLLALCLAMAITFALTACGGGSSSGTSQSSGSQSGSAAQSQPTGDAQGLKIAIVTSPNSVDDGSFNEDNYNGVLNFIASRGDIDTVTPVQETSGDSAAVAQLVGDAFEVTFPRAYEPYTVSVYSMDGTLLKTLQGNGGTGKVSVGCPAERGCYILRAAQGNDIYTQKFYY